MFDISIILCVYNGERWINDCLDMLYSQTVLKKEIIVIDDGSEDLTLQLIEQSIREHSEENIRVYHRQNCGLSISRLDGMRLAKGKYIGFVDVDDSFENDMFESMLRVAESRNYDIVECKYDIMEDKNCRRYFDMLKKAEEGLQNYYSRMSKEMFGTDIINSFLMGFVHEPMWMRIYKKKIVKKMYHLIEKNFDIYQMFFKIKNDDMFFTPAIFMEARSYAMLDEIKYHYRLLSPNGSRMSDMKSKRKLTNMNKILVKAGFFIKKYYELKQGKNENVNTLNLIEVYLGNRIVSYFREFYGNPVNALRECISIVPVREIIKAIIVFKIAGWEKLVGSLS